MQIPREEEFNVLHAAKTEFSHRMPRRTVNASFYAKDIEGAQAGTHKTIRPRRNPVNPANPMYLPLEQPSAELADARARERIRDDDSGRSSREPPRGARRSELAVTWRANEAVLAQPTIVRERRHFRETNYVGDIEGARPRRGPFTAEGKPVRRQVDPLEPTYSWGGTTHGRRAARAREPDESEQLPEAYATLRMPSEEPPRLAPPQPPRPDRRVRYETHLGPGLTMITQRLEQPELAPPPPPPPARRRPRGEPRSEQTRADLFARAAAAKLAQQAAEYRPPPPDRRPPDALTPPARSARLMIDRSLTNADIAGAPAHREHRKAAGIGVVRERRDIRDPMVLLPREYQHY